MRILLMRWEYRVKKNAFENLINGRYLQFMWATYMSKRVVEQSGKIR